jgi:hypothetical protein
MSGLVLCQFEDSPRTRLELTSSTSPSIWNKFGLKSSKNSLRVKREQLELF